MKSYLQLFLSNLQPGAKSGSRATVVAFTSAESGEGVSHVAGSFGVEMARKTRRRTLVADLASLQQIDILHYSRVAKFCFQTSVKNLYVLPSADELPLDDEPATKLAPRRAQSEIERGLSNLKTLRYIFDFVLLDCPSLKESSDAALFAEGANGVIMVVEAERTRRDQVKNAIRTIEMANGKLLGCVLNKRRYPVPDWLYHRI